MRTDISLMKAFYENSLGQAAARQIARRVETLWPNLKGETVMGFGYTPPILEPILIKAGAGRVMSLMPAEQGGWAWPLGKKCLNAVTNETNLPLPDRSIDRIILMHALEDTSAERVLLREIWRVLADSGRLIVIAANRRGLWCRTDNSPFGHGRPYSLKQLTKTLEQSLFNVEHSVYALYQPPSNRMLPLWSSDTLEKFGHRWLGGFSGVVIVDATKSIYGLAPRNKALAAASGKRGMIPIGDNRHENSTPASTDPCNVPPNRS